jgi:hypothetical protein
VLTATTTGRAHAVALWMEYACCGGGGGDDRGVVQSAAPDASHSWASQGLRLLETPLAVKPMQRVTVRVTCGGGGGAGVWVDIDEQ